MSDKHEHVELMVEGAPPGKTQPVEVEAISVDHYRVLCSPGFVEGIAAGRHHQNHRQGIRAIRGRVPGRQCGASAISNGK